LPEANNQQAVNHTVSGVRVRSKIVPAVVEVHTWQPEHSNLPSPSRQPPAWPQSGQTKPPGHPVQRVPEGVAVQQRALFGVGAVGEGCGDPVLESDQVFVAGGQRTGGDQDAAQVP